jgi:four helix bundle protein
MSYRKLEIWKLSREVVIEIHKMSLQLPKFEMFEEGQQIRRSSKSVKSTIWKVMEEDCTRMNLLNSSFMRMLQTMKQSIIWKIFLKPAH